MAVEANLKDFKIKYIVPFCNKTIVLKPIHVLEKIQVIITLQNH